VGAADPKKIDRMSRMCAKHTWPGKLLNSAAMRDSAG
jgi:hypothetical protein